MLAIGSLIAAGVKLASSHAKKANYLDNVAQHEARCKYLMKL